MKKNNAYIIAEIGINHNGKKNDLIKLIYSAKKAGADAVKFQLFKAETLADKNLKDKSYYSIKDKKETLYQMWKKFEINQFKLKLINEICKKINIDLIFSVFDYESLKKLQKIKYKYLKIASSDINDFPLLKRIKLLKKKVIISTGMASKKEIEDVVKFFGKRNIFLLHCVSIYPCPEKFINLKRINNLRKLFNINIGFSDHTEGMNASLMALTMGINVLEKHFTLDKATFGPDHKLSADENELKIICDFSKKIKILTGDGKIDPSNKEKKTLKFARKSIYLKKDILKNEIFDESHIIIKRPNGFFKPIDLRKILKNKATKDIKAGTNLNFSHYKN